MSRWTVKSPRFVRPHLLSLLALLAVLLAAVWPGEPAAAAPRPPARPATGPYAVYLPLVMRSGVVGLPVITSFTANPSNTTPGGGSLLSWAVSSADSLSIDSGVGPVSGSSVTVNPATTTTYTLSATNAAGTTTAKTTITVSGGSSAPAGALLPYLLSNGGIMSNKTPQIAVDPSGGVHVAYTGDGPDNNGVWPAYYGYCPANCTSATNYMVLQFGDSMLSAQLALDPAGHPRLLLEAQPVVGGSLADSPAHYYYGECNTACTNSANWTFADVVDAIPHNFPTFTQSNEWFALDAQGRPRFIYYVNTWQVTPDQSGTFYAYCDSGCTDATNWYATRLTPDEWQNPALAFTPDGLPRLAYAVNLLDSNNFPTPYLAYLECASTDCATWTGDNLLASASYHPASDAVFALRIDSLGRPRMAYFPGDGSGGTLQPNALYYLSCNQGCNQAANWSNLSLGTNVGNFGVDLRLDAQDHPRLAYRDNTAWELGYGWCNTNCESSTDGWGAQLIPSRAATDLELGHIRYSCPNCYPPIPDCVSGWDAGNWPSLALDPAGNPRLAFEVDLRSGIGCSAEVLARFSRVAVFNQP